MQEKSAVKARISEYLEYKGLTKYAFYKNSGVSRGILDQNTGITEENINRFLAYAPEVSPGWLIAGVGRMLISEDMSHPGAGNLLYPMNRGIAAYASDVKAGYQASSDCHTEIPILDMSKAAADKQRSSWINTTSRTMSLPLSMLHTGYEYGAIIYRGSSSGIEYSDGDILIGRLTNDISEPSGNDMVVVAAKDGRWVVGRVAGAATDRIVLYTGDLKTGRADVYYSSKDINGLWIVERIMSAPSTTSTDDYGTRLRIIEEEMAHIRKLLRKDSGSKQ